MSVLAIFSIGAFPEPTEFLWLNRLDEMFAYDLLGTDEKGESKNKHDANADISCSAWVACFWQHHSSEFLFIPGIHRIYE